MGHLWASSVSSTAWPSSAPSHTEKGGAHECSVSNMSASGHPHSSCEEGAGMGWLLAATWGKVGLSGTLSRRTCTELSYRDGRPSCVDSGHSFPEYPDGPGSVSPELLGLLTFLRTSRPPPLPAITIPIVNLHLYGPRKQTENPG